MGACQTDFWANENQLTEVWNHYCATWILHFSQDYELYHLTAIIAISFLYILSFLLLIHKYRVQFSHPAIA